MRPAGPANRKRWRVTGPGRRRTLAAAVLLSQAGSLRWVGRTRRGARRRTPVPPADAGPRFDLLPAGPPGVYRLVGEADVSARSALRAGLASAVAAGTGDVLLDLTALTFIDVGSTAELVGAARRLGDGRRLVLDRASPILCRIIALAWGKPPGLEVRPR